tara:strand:+ start:202 stop:513 length:312 start_codon:yes stop_codon:yes gene_type:complete
MMKIKKGDSVFVICGKDKGKTGQVLKIFPAKNKALIQGINMVKKHNKPSANTKGGIENIEMPIHVSNLAYNDPKLNKPSRIGYKILEDGKKVRLSKKSGETIT